MSEHETASPVIHPTRAVPLGHGGEPPPPEWDVEDLVPRGHLTILYGDGGVGKSMVALYLALRLVRGEEFLGKRTRMGAVLWVDAENLGEDTMHRRAYQVARGMGLGRPPEGAYYYAPEKPVGHQQTADEVKAIIHEYDIALVVLDSLTLGAAGTDSADQRAVTELLRAIEEWEASVLALDHIAKASRSNQKQASIFGSVFKRNKARSSLRLYKDGDLLYLAQDKSNFGPLHDPFSYSVQILEGDDGKTTVQFEAKEAYLFDCDTEELLRDWDGPEPTNADRVLWAVSAIYTETEEAVGAARVAAESGVEVRQVRNELAGLARSGVLDRPERGLYQPARTADP